LVGRLSTVQTTHETDRVIGSLVARERAMLSSLVKWMQKGSPVLRVNSAGILAKAGVTAIDNDVSLALKADPESRHLYLTAVASRVLGLSWDDAGHLLASGQPVAAPGELESLAVEMRNPYDAGARWCSTVLLARTHPADQPEPVIGALRRALATESSLENLRATACALAGLDPLTV